MVRRLLCRLLGHRWQWRYVGYTRTREVWERECDRCDRSEWEWRPRRKCKARVRA